MTPPPEGTPWWAWALIASLVIVVPALSGIVVARLNRPTRQAAERAAASAAHAATELTPNHGSSAKDSLGRLEEMVGAIDRKVDAQAARTAELARSVGGLHDDIRQERDERASGVRDLGERVTHLERGRHAAP